MPKYGAKKIRVKNPKGYRARRGAIKGYSVSTKATRKGKRKPQGAEPRFPKQQAGYVYNIND